MPTLPNGSSPTTVTHIFSSFFLLPLELSSLSLSDSHFFFTVAISLSLSLSLSAVRTPSIVFILDTLLSSHLTGRVPSHTLSLQTPRSDHGCSSAAPSAPPGPHWPFKCDVLRVQRRGERSSPAESPGLRLRRRSRLQPDPLDRVLLPAQHRQEPLRLRREQLLPAQGPGHRELRLRRVRRHLRHRTHSNDWMCLPCKFQHIRRNQHDPVY